ncbi:hypothetical protein JCM10449v2_005906 [Rhodotorula kratochvilovae]
MTTPARPLVDRRRSSSRERGALVRPTLSPSHSSASMSALASPLASPVGSPPALQSILKRHPAEQDDRSAPKVGDSISTLSLGPAGGASASVTTVGGSSATSLTEGSDGRATPASGAGGVRGAQFKRRVGFDTWGAGEELEGKAKATGGGTGVAYSFTLSAKSADFCRTRWSRTFLVATDLNEYSVNATDWLLTSFLEDSDEVVVLRVIEPGSSAHNAWRASMEEARDEAEKVLEELMRKNGERKHISLIVEFAIGPIEETIHRMIEIYKPDSLIVGTRGRPDSLFKSAFMGSISRLWQELGVDEFVVWEKGTDAPLPRVCSWAVARSPVPVVVVRPDAKVREALERRLQDHKRGRSYVSLLSEAEQRRALPSPAPTPMTAAASAGAPLERTVTAPEAGEREEEPAAKGSSGGGGLKVAFGLGTKDKKKKDKGKEFKRFGTFS